MPKPPSKRLVPDHAKYVRILAAIVALAQVIALQPPVCKAVGFRVCGVKT
jgi:hypothetical protein